MNTNVFFAIAGVVTVATVTPGPNNFIVMSAAARDGLRVTRRLIGAVIGGGVLLFCLTWWGAGLANPRFHLLAASLGSIYLVWLGVAMIRNAARATDAPTSRASALPDTWPAVLLFQFLNAKAWVLALTVTSVARSLDQAWAFAVVVTTFAVISAASLVLWSMAGSMLRQTFHDRHAARYFGGAMGMLLLLSSFGLLFSLFDNGVM